MACFNGQILQCSAAQIPLRLFGTVPNYECADRCFLNSNKCCNTETIQTTDITPALYISPNAYPDDSASLTHMKSPGETISSANVNTSGNGTSGGKEPYKAKFRRIEKSHLPKKIFHPAIKKKEIIKTSDIPVAKTSANKYFKFVTKSNNIIKELAKPQTLPSGLVYTSSLANGKRTDGEIKETLDSPGILPVHEPQDNLQFKMEIDSIMDVKSCVPGIHTDMTFSEKYSECDDDEKTIESVSSVNTVKNLKERTELISKTMTFLLSQYSAIVLENAKNEENFTQIQNSVDSSTFFLNSQLSNLESCINSLSDDTIIKIDRELKFSKTHEENVLKMNISCPEFATQIPFSINFCVHDNPESPVSIKISCIGTSNPNGTIIIECELEPDGSFYHIDGNVSHSFTGLECILTSYPFVKCQHLDGNDITAICFSVTCNVDNAVKIYEVVQNRPRKIIWCANT